jgi:DNA polymerase III delta subunit
MAVLKSLSSLISHGENFSHIQGIVLYGFDGSHRLMRKEVLKILMKERFPHMVCVHGQDYQPHQNRGLFDISLPFQWIECLDMTDGQLKKVWPFAKETNQENSFWIFTSGKWNTKTAFIKEAEKLPHILVMGCYGTDRGEIVHILNRFIPCLKDRLHHSAESVLVQRLSHQPAQILQLIEKLKCFPDDMPISEDLISDLIPPPLDENWEDAAYALTGGRMNEFHDSAMILLNQESDKISGLRAIYRHCFQIYQVKAFKKPPPFLPFSRREEFEKNVKKCHIKQLRFWMNQSLILESQIKSSIIVSNVQLIHTFIEGNISS